MLRPPRLLHKRRLAPPGDCDLKCGPANERLTSNDLISEMAVPKRPCPDVKRNGDQESQMVENEGALTTR